MLVPGQSLARIARAGCTRGCKPFIRLHESTASAAAKSSLAASRHDPSATRLDDLGRPNPFGHHDRQATNHRFGDDIAEILGH